MKTIGKMFMCLLTVALLVIFGVSGYRIWQILGERQSAENVYEDLNQFVHLPQAASAQNGTDTTGIHPGQTETAPVEEATFPEVDFDSLRSINEQVVGWIYDEASVINYPIVQAKDNDYYLHHLFNGETNRDGCIFLDSQNQRDFSDSHCIIYGHYMKSGAMFAALANYKSQEYYEEHPRMLLLTPNGNYTIEIFAGYVANVQDDAWTTGFGSEAEYESWITSSISKSLISSAIRPTASDHILTLSTCSYEFADARFVLLGVLQAQGEESDNQADILP